MNFLEAHRTLSGFTGGAPLPFLLAMSGTSGTLNIFLRAAAAKRGRAAVVRTLPFNTLAQALLSPAALEERELFLLLPWDFVPEADWRSGIPAVTLDERLLRERAIVTAERLAARPRASLFYVPAPIPPLFSDAVATASLDGWLGGVARAAGAYVLPPDTFSLSSYLASGCPIAGRRLGAVADAIVQRAAAAPAESCKVLVTDLDNVMWSGVIGEDGLEGILCAPEGPGFRFFLYQSLLARLMRDGVLLAAVSRNDEELALSPFHACRTLLTQADFVCIIASYQAKSAQIAEIAARLNLGLHSIVFVDDNPMELAEVSTQLPHVRCVRFPEGDDGLPQFFTELARLFTRSTVTAEDRDRTEMYRRRLAGIAPSGAQGADLTAFLRELEMTLVIHDRSSGERVRAVQLINKTNQFNLNGRRITDDEVAALLAAGGHLYTASLRDRSGTHGEILACIIDAGGVVRSLVLSCRVFQRRVEYAFFAWLAAQDTQPVALEFAATPRNEPMRHFLSDPAFSTAADDLVAFDAVCFLEGHSDDPALFAFSHEAQAPETARAGRMQSDPPRPLHEVT